MKRTLRTIAAGVIGLLLGLLAARQIDSTTENDRISQAGSIQNKVSPREDKPISKPKTGDPHTLAGLQNRIETVGKDMQLEMQFERMEISELKTLIEEIIAKLTENPDRLEPFSKEESLSRQANLLLAKMAGVELFRREGEPAIEWANKLSKEVRQGVLRDMLFEAATTDPKMSKPWSDAWMKDYGTIGNFEMNAAAGAAQRGPEALAEVLELYQWRHLSPYYEVGDFSDDFDFSKFHALLKNENPVPMSAFAIWASRDRDAALNAVLKDDPKKNVRYLGSVFEGISAVEGRTKAAEWIIGNLDRFPAEVHDDAIRALRGTDKLTSKEITTVLGSLLTDHDRLTYATEVISPWSSPDTARAALAGLSSPAQQAEALSRCAEKAQGAIQRGGETRETTLAFFESMMSEVRLSAEAQSQVRTILNESNPKK